MWKGAWKILYKQHTLEESKSLEKTNLIKIDELKKSHTIRLTYCSYACGKNTYFEQFSEISMKATRQISWMASPYSTIAAQVEKSRFLDSFTFKTLRFRLFCSSFFTVLPGNWSSCFSPGNNSARTNVSNFVHELASKSKKSFKRSPVCTEILKHCNVCRSKMLVYLFHFLWRRHISFAGHNSCFITDINYNFIFLLVGSFYTSLYSSPNSITSFRLN